MLEYKFTDRLEYNKDVLTKKLQSNFNIVPRLNNGKILLKSTLDNLSSFDTDINLKIILSNIYLKF